MPNKRMIRFGSRMNVFFYRISGGRLMKESNGLPILLLTTTGRNSGKPHTCPVVYLKHDGSFVIMPGVFERPDWYLNLEAAPKASILLEGKTFQVEAREAGAEEREVIWRNVPAYWREYQAQYDEQLPLVLLKPVE